MLFTLPSISYVVARSLPGYVIGVENRLPWRLQSDLRRFKEITIGHPIIMGRKTYLSIGRTLPHRINIVLSRRATKEAQSDFWRGADTAAVWAGNRESALYFADVISIARNQTDIFVIGGAEMYAIFNKLFNKIYLTEVLTGEEVPGDAKFDFPIDRRRWSTLLDQQFPAGPSDQYPSRFRVLERKRKWVRYVEINEFYTDSVARKHWLTRQLDLFEDYKAKDVHKPFVIPYQFKLFEEPLAA